MNLKKIFTVLFIMCLILTSGCGAGGLSEGRTSGPAMGNGGPPDRGTDSSVKEKAAGRQETTDRPVIEKAAIYTREADDNNEIVFVDGRHERVRISADSRDHYRKLSDALDRIMEKEDANYNDLVKEYREMREEYAKDGMGGDTPNMIKDQFFVRRADKDVLSLLERSFSYAGGAHGDTGFFTVNLDARTGQEIRLEDVIKDRDLLREALKKELLEKYGKNTFFFEEMDDNIKSILEEKDGIKCDWTLDPQGITFYYSDYDIAPYAAGTQNVTLLYSSHEDLFTDKYRPAKGEGYISGFFDYDEFSVDADGNGKTGPVSVDYSYGDDPDIIEGFEVTAGGNTVAIDDLYCFEISQYIVHTSSGKTFLYVWTTEENDWMTIYLYDISSGKPVSAGTAELSPDFAVDEGDDDYSIYGKVITDPDYMKLQTRFDLLSTYEAKKTYRVKDAPQPVTDDPYYVITSNITLKSKQEIRGDLVDEKGNVLKKSVKIPAGSDFALYRTDGKEVVDTRLEDGKLLRLKVEGTYPPYVNGIDANELFEQLFYAG